MGLPICLTKHVALNLQESGWLTAWSEPEFQRYANGRGSPPYSTVIEGYLIKATQVGDLSQSTGDQADPRNHLAICTDCNGKERLTLIQLAFFQRQQRGRGGKNL